MTTKEEEKRSVWFLPWLGIKEPFRIGKCEIWPFQKEFEDRIEDQKLREYLASYFQTYTDFNSNPVDTVAVCSVDSRNFRILNPSDAERVRLAVDNLIFQAIVKNRKAEIISDRFEQSMGYPSADRFKLYVQNFRVDSKYFAIGTGQALVGGLEIGKFKVSQPLSLGHPFWSVEENVQQAFQVLISSKNKRLLKIIKNGLEWFRLAHTDSDDVTRETRFVMMATALEVMLETPMSEQNKQLWIAQWFDSNCAVAPEIRKSWWSDDADHSAIGHWARSFYDIRNKIVHAGKGSANQYETPTGKSIDYLHIADVVFREVILRKLYSAGCFPNLSSYEQSTRDLLFVSSLSINDIHRKLGWTQI